MQAVDRSALPDDVEVLKDLVVDALSQLEAFKQQLLALRRAHFGASSERLSGQAELFAEAAQFPAPPAPATESSAYERRKSGRPALPAGLPRRRIEYELADAERAEFVRCEPIGEEVSETLEYTPARLVVIEHARRKYRCEDASGAVSIRTAAAECSPLAKSNAGAGLLAQVLVAKYADALPLARQERILLRATVRRSRERRCATGHSAQPSCSGR